MRCISYYEEYPIYEPAEGGYYYAGNQLIESERKSKRQCRKEFEAIWAECMKENESGIDSPWIRVDDNCIRRYSQYIGEGESIVIEKKSGSYKKGWKPYC